MFTISNISMSECVHVESGSIIVTITGTEEALGDSAKSKRKFITFFDDHFYEMRL